jgi:hypothetical protein
VTPIFYIDETLKEWATEDQKEKIDAINREGSYTKAAASLGVTQSSISHSIARLKRSAALHGYSPERGLTHPLPPGLMVNGVSNYYDSDGSLKGQWVKASVDRSAKEALMREVVESLMQ